MCQDPCIYSDKSIVGIKKKPITARKFSKEGQGKVAHNTSSRHHLYVDYIEKPISFHVVGESISDRRYKIWYKRGIDLTITVYFHDDIVAICKCCSKASDHSA